MIVSFDTETFLTQPGLLAPPLVCGSWMEVGKVPFVGDRRHALTVFWNLVHSPVCHIVGHNIAYDLGVLCNEDPSLVPLVFEAMEQGRIHDTGIRESLIDIARGTLGLDPKTGRQIPDDEGIRYSLAYLVDRYLGKDISASKHAPDAWRLRYGELAGIPIEDWPAEALEYPKQDAEHTLLVYFAQEKAAALESNKGNLHDEARSVYNAWVLHLISCWGLRTNPEKVAALEAKVDADYQAAQAEFKKVGIIREDGTEDKARVQALVEAAYDGNPPRTPKGGIATDRDTKVESGDPALLAHAKSGKNDKYRTTYLPKIKGGTLVPINPAFYGMAATTRVTSDYQQLPQKGGIRECHEARPGFVYCSVDYGGLELRTMSQRAIWHPEIGYSRMAEVLLSGRDVHCHAGAEMMGTTYETFFAKHEAHDEAVGPFRKLAKIFNFGKGGGMGDKALAFNARSKENVRFCQLTGALEKCGSEGFVEARIQGRTKRVCSVCVEVATKLGKDWRRAWPEQEALFQIAARMTSAERKVNAMIPHVNVLRGECGYTQWLNTPFQGLGAVVTTLAMRRISREMYVDRGSPLWGSRLVLNVHDELIGELREDVMHDAATRMADLMKQAAAEVMPDLAAAIEAEPALSRILSKDATTVRDATGKLIPWEPKAA